MHDNNKFFLSTLVSVDVVIPVYNGEKFIIDAIDSVAKQSFSVSKIIVIDDGSTDSTSELIGNYISSSPAKIVYHQKKNGGLSSARNAGIRLSTSKYVAFLDADDIWMTNKIKCQILKLQEYSHESNLGVIYCDFQLIDESGILMDQFSRSNILKSIKGCVFKKLLKGNYVSGSGSAVLVKRDCFEKCGLFDEQLPSCEDWDMWLRISKHYDFDYVDKKLVQIRRHDNGMQKNNIKMILGHIILFNKLFLTGDLLIRNILQLRAQMWDCSVNFSELSSKTESDRAFKRIVSSYFISFLLLIYLVLRRIKWHMNGLKVKFLISLKTNKVK